jgi:hypothetical protein
MISRTNLFAKLITNINPLLAKLKTKPNTFPNSSSVSAAFLALNDDFKLELLSGIRSLKAYETHSKSANERRRKLFRLLSWRQQNLCQDVGYLDKLKSIDRLIDLNQQVLTQVADFSQNHYGLSYDDFHYLKNNSPSNQTSNSNYRVIEVLGHLKRDWCQGNEIDPLLSYICRGLNKVIPPEKRGDTCVIVAGSGLGRIAHEVATLGFGHVHAIEYSGLMHLCNQFIYANDKPLKIYPYVHSCSNFVDTESQSRFDTINPVQKPNNLTLNLDDFRYFSVEDKFQNVVVVSAFFIDTAENVIDYFDSMQKLTAPSRNNAIENGYWINIGPLKYGTAAQAELNAEEITKIRHKMGWNDLDYKNGVNPDELVGYITDKQSFWQGYYGVSQWTSQRKENKTKVQC